MSIYEKLLLVQENEWSFEYRGKVLYRKVVPYKRINGYPKYLGYQYYSNGQVEFEGVLQRGGLFEGKCYYSSGQVKFIGRCNEREKDGYYGPPYPVYGEYFSEDGSLLYQGRFDVDRIGGVGWPRVRIPKDF